MRRGWSGGKSQTDPLAVPLVDRPFVSMIPAHISGDAFQSGYRNCRCMLWSNRLQATLKCWSRQEGRIVKWKRIEARQAGATFQSLARIGHGQAWHIKRLTAVLHHLLKDMLEKFFSWRVPELKPWLPSLYIVIHWCCLVASPKQR